MPWEELDKEEKALAHDIYAGLGNHPDFADWYGGKVAFRGKVKAGKDGYRLVLDRGRFGSTYFIRVKIDTAIKLELVVPRDYNKSSNNYVTDAKLSSH